MSFRILHFHGDQGYVLLRPAFDTKSANSPNLKFLGRLRIGKAGNFEEAKEEANSRGHISQFPSELLSEIMC